MTHVVSDDTSPCGWLVWQEAQQATELQQPVQEEGSQEVQEEEDTEVADVPVSACSH